jgi:hypothetical protein
MTDVQQRALRIYQDPEHSGQEMQHSGNQASKW